MAFTFNQKLREKRKREQAEKKKHMKNQESADFSGDSDSESVSGGDDEPEIEVDQSLVDIVKKTHAEVSLLAKATVGGKLVSKIMDDNVAELPKPPPLKTAQSTANVPQTSTRVSMPTVPKAITKGGSSVLQANQSNGVSNNSVCRKKPNAAAINSGSQFSSQNVTKASNREAQRNVRHVGPKENTTITQNLNLAIKSSIADDDYAIESSPVATSEEFQSKNMAALIMIRKLKQTKVSANSTLVTTNNISSFLEQSCFRDRRNRR